MTTPSPPPAGADLELTVLMPCLDEAETLAGCVRRAVGFLRENGIEGEVVVADNGSRDGSREIASEAGARVVEVAERGYGAAPLGGVAAARGRFVVMGDADASYDFSALGPFVEALRGGADLVMGNRFRGGIAKGAMPFLHRWLGNPVLSFLGRALFRIDVGDFHCGLRGFRRDRLLALGLRTTGMEFASEMVVRSALAGHRIVEVPTTLSPDGRSRPPHLRTWRDGWRHLRFLLLFSPRWLFAYPGAALVAVGVAGSAALFSGPLRVGAVALDVHTFVVACLAALAGVQLLGFAWLGRRFAVRWRMLPARRGAGEAPPIERLLGGAVLLAAAGLVGIALCTARWAAAGFGDLVDPRVLRTMIASATAVAAGLQLGATAFVGGLFEIPSRDG